MCRHTRCPFHLVDMASSPAQQAYETSVYEEKTEIPGEKLKVFIERKNICELERKDSRAY